MSYLDRTAKLLRTRSLWLWLFAALALAFLSIYVFYAVVIALKNGTDFRGYAADGAFQLYNPMRRMAAGQVPGRDFPFFHGLGVPLIHYIPFILLGGNVFASETTRWLTSMGLFVVSSLAFFLALFRSWRRSLIATALVTVIAINYVPVTYPGNSLLGVRTTFPMVTATVLLWRSEKRLTVGRFGIDLRHLLAVACLALSFVCGTEQGIAAVVAYAAVRAWELWRHRTKLQALLQLAVEGGLVAVGVVGLLTVITLGHPLRALRFALVDIPSDQGWYFGAPPNDYLTWHDLLPMMSTVSMRYYYVILLAAIAMMIVFRRMDMVTARERNVYVFLLLYGTATLYSVTGYFAPPVQLLPMMRGALLIAVGIGVSVLFSDRTWEYLTTHRLRLTHYRRAGAAAAMLVVGVVVAMSLVLQSQRMYAGTATVNLGSLVTTAETARHGDDYYAAGIGWKAAFNSFRPELEKPNTTVWSTYSSLYESELGIFHPSKGGRDYIIHALGKKGRETYLKQFIHDRPEYVITLKPSYFLYEEWLWSRDWPFYAQLMSHYTLVKENTSHYLWHLNAKPLRIGSAWKPLRKAGARAYDLPANTGHSVKLYEVRVRYRAGSGLPAKLLGNLPKYLLKPRDTGLQYDISLPPYETTWTVGVPVMPGQTRPDLDIRTDGIVPTAQLDVASMEYRELTLTRADATLFRMNDCQRVRTCVRRVKVPVTAGA